MIDGHGGNIFALARRLGCAPEDIVDMSSNINPLGMMPGLLPYLQERLHTLGRLPEVSADTAVQGIADMLNVDAEQILSANGTTQFIYTLCPALCPTNVLIIGPAYADYASSCRMYGLEPDFFLTRPEQDFVLDVQALDQVLSGPKHYDLVFCCNPCNPTGAFIAPKHLLDCIRQHPTTCFVVDESYLGFIEEPLGRSLSHPSLGGLEQENLALLWSVSKTYGIPGLRAGFLLAGPRILSQVQQYMQPWAMNSLAVEAVRFIHDQHVAAHRFVAEARAYIEVEKEAFFVRMQERELKFTIYPSVSPYFLLQVPAPFTSAQVCGHLADQGYLIRDCSNFVGLDERFIRIALKGQDENRAVVDLLQSSIKKYA